MSTGKREICPPRTARLIIQEIQFFSFLLPVSGLFAVREREREMMMSADVASKKDAEPVTAACHLAAPSAVLRSLTGTASFEVNVASAPRHIAVTISVPFICIVRLVISFHEMQLFSHHYPKNFLLGWMTLSGENSCRQYISAEWSIRRALAIGRRCLPSACISSCTNHSPPTELSHS